MYIILLNLIIVLIATFFFFLQILICPPSNGGLSSLYYHVFLHFNLPHVDQVTGFDPCPISTFLKSLGVTVRLNTTIQVSHLYKCGQEVSCRAFNAVTAAFF